MKDRLHIDELRDLVGHLKKGAESLYRYGDAGSSKTLFNNLSDNDQKRLLYFALKEDDSDINNVAKHFMQQLNPTPKDFKDLLTQMNPTDKAEIEKIESEIKKEIPELSNIDRQRISDILSEACDTIGFLGHEEAYWILISSETPTKVTWIRASGKGKNDFTHIRLPDRVQYDPDKKELYELLNAMRESSWVLHIHNHPQIPDITKTLYYGASLEDSSHASYWKHLRPELTTKMKFFVIQQNTAFEYREEGDNIQWLGEKIENKPLSEKEYYDKQFPLDVAQKMLEEKRKEFYDKLFENG